MALILKDRVKETSSSSGTGNITLGGAFPGYQTFNAAIASGSTVYYTIHNLTAGVDNEWEVGLGTFTSPATLARTTVLSSSTGSAVNFTAGASGLEVFITQPAEEAVYLNNATGLVEIGGNGTNTVSFTNINTTNLTATTVTLTAGTISTNASNTTDIVNKQYVDGIVAAGVHYHEPVLVESPTALIATYNQPGGAGNGVGATLTNSGSNVALSIDGVSLSNTARVLVYTQSNAVQNGVYTVTNPGAPDAPGPGVAWVLTRATDADTYVVASSAGLSEGSTFFVQSGNTGAGEVYTCNTQGTITFGTTDITFAQIGSAQIYSAGTGLSLTNTTFSIANTAVTAAQYGNDGNVAQITVNAQGQLTNAANVSINASSITVGTLAVANGGTGTGTAGITALNNILGSSLAGTTGTNTTNLVFSTSPTLTSPTAQTSLATGSGTFALVNTSAVTVNAFGATTTLNQGVSTANLTHNYSTGATLSGNTKTINLGTGGVSGSTTAINIGSANGTTVTVNGTTNLANVNVSGNVSAGGSISGNGATLSAINASNISSGTIDNARTTAASANGASTIVLRDSGGSFDANLVNAVSLSGNAATVTGINASNIASGTIANARTTAATANGASTIVLRGASGEFAAGAITGTSFSGNGSAITAINASAISSGTLVVGRGGTGQTTLTAENVILGNGASAVKVVAPGTANNVLTSNGSTWISQAAAAGGTLIPSGTVMLFAQTAAPTGFTKNVSTGDNSALRVTTGTASSGGSVAFTTAFVSQTPTGSVSTTVNNQTATNQAQTATNIGATATNQATTATNQAITPAGSVSITAVAGSAGATTLSTPQIPSHNHTVPSRDDGTGGAGATLYNNGPSTRTITSSSTGGGGSHTHPFSFSSGSGTFSGNSVTALQNSHNHTQDSHNHTQNAHNHTQDAHNHTASSSFTGNAINLAVQYIDVIRATKD
jgi:hypothetical protein